MRIWQCPSRILLLALIAGCGGGGGNPDPRDTNPPAPATPTGISAIGAADSIEVSWTHTMGASQYVMYWSETPGVTAQNGNRATSGSSPGIITGLRDDTIYYVVVAAANNVGNESAVSGEVSAQPVATWPGRITTVAAMPGDGQLTVTWDDQINADTYTVYASTHPEGRKEIPFANGRNREQRNRGGNSVAT